jgi:CTP:phosphocholine cytidylyltransferase-like protein
MINKQLFDVLVELSATKENCNKIYIDKLVEAGLYNGREITPSGMNLLNSHKIDNAIILAAGISSRFVPIAFDKPKGLLIVNDETLIERQIRQLREKGIDEIIIIVGYKKEQFSYLQDKYNIILIENADYNIKNNYASVYAARAYLKNTIISSSDLYFSKNLFQKYAFDSFYCSIFINGATDERGLVIDENDKIIDTYYNCHDIWVSLGYAFFSEGFSKKYIKITSHIINDPLSYNKFWADVQDDNLSDLYMYIKRCDKKDIHEFDSLKELYEFEPSYIGCSESETLKYICTALHCKEKDLYNFTPISMKGSFKACSFRYSNVLFYFCISITDFINANEFCKIMVNSKFCLIDVDIKNNRALLKMQEEYNG